MATRKPADPAAPKRTRKAPTAPPAAASNYPVLKDKKTIEAAEAYAKNKAEISRLEALNEVLKPQLVAAMEGAPIAYAGARVLNLSTVEATPATENQVITRAMLGSVIPGKKGRKGYTQLSVT